MDSTLQDTLRNNPETDFYRDLGVARNAPEVDIRRAYRSAAARFHPDRQPADATPEVKQTAEENFKKAKAAYEVLSDSEKRTQYNAFHDNPQLRAQYIAARDQRDASSRHYAQQAEQEQRAREARAAANRERAAAAERERQQEELRRAQERAQAAAGSGQRQPPPGSAGPQPSAGTGAGSAGAQQNGSRAGGADPNLDFYRERAERMAVEARAAVGSATAGAGSGPSATGPSTSSTGPASVGPAAAAARGAGGGGGSGGSGPTASGTAAGGGAARASGSPTKPWRKLAGGAGAAALVAGIIAFGYNYLNGGKDEPQIYTDIKTPLKPMQQFVINSELGIAMELGNPAVHKKLGLSPIEANLLRVNLGSDQTRDMIAAGMANARASKVEITLVLESEKDERVKDAAKKVIVTHTPDGITFKSPAGEHRMDTPPLAKAQLAGGPEDIKRATVEAARIPPKPSTP